MPTYPLLTLAREYGGRWGPGARSSPGSAANGIIQPRANSLHLLWEARGMPGIRDDRWLFPPRPTPVDW